jgi:hypothetical protein
MKVCRQPAFGKFVLNMRHFDRILGIRYYNAEVLKKQMSQRKYSYSVAKEY